MAETQLGKEIIGLIETLEKAAIAIKAFKDHMVQITETLNQAKDSLEEKPEDEKEPGSST